MPRNGSGVYSLPAGTIVANGQALDESQHNPAMLDIAAEFNAARPIVAGGTGATSASGARTALGLAIGSDVQAHDATLTSLAALGTAADKFAYTTGVDTWAEAEITAQGRALLDDADATAQRATLGLGAAATAGFLDEDNFASNSATAAPSQQSTKAYVDAAIPAKLNASGSAPIYACRAWVNFNGTETVAIRAAGNVSSITDNGVGNYTINFTTEMPDANYVAIPYGKKTNDAAVGSSGDRSQSYVHTKTAGGFKLIHCDGNGSTLIDPVVSDVAVFR